MLVSCKRCQGCTTSPHPLIFQPCPQHDCSVPSSTLPHGSESCSLGWAETSAPSSPALVYSSTSSSVLEYKSVLRLPPREGKQHLSASKPPLPSLVMSRSLAVGTPRQSRGCFRERKPKAIFQSPRSLCLLSITGGIFVALFPNKWPTTSQG